ncbi:hypothetical protein VTN96DRAFT_4206 [Rasamsonia emersonii]
MRLANYSKLLGQAPPRPKFTSNPVIVVAAGAESDLRGKSSDLFLLWGSSESSSLAPVLLLHSGIAQAATPSGSLLAPSLRSVPPPVDASCVVDIRLLPPPWRNSYRADALLVNQDGAAIS